MKKILLSAFLLTATLFSDFCYGSSENNAPYTSLKTARFLYEKCKEALSSTDFENSYCAAYIEGYKGGNTSGLHILGQADNQKEIIEKYDKSRCSDLGEEVRRDERVRWLASYFVSWIDNSQAAIRAEFLSGAAAGLLYLLTTDQRFCIKPEILDRLARRCSQLSEQTGHSHQILTGIAHRSEVRNSDVDCPLSDCSPLQAATETLFQPLLFNIDEPPLVVLTPLEDEELDEKRPYIRINGTYALCARFLEERPPFGQKYFQIDDLNAIEELKSSADPAFLNLLKRHQSGVGEEWYGKH